MPFQKANTLNNLAYALADLGQIDLAQVQIEEAIRLRKDLGQQFVLALSYNVQGYIYTLSDHTRWGMDSCTEALRIFRKLGDLRGMGLALNTLGFACRKRADQWKLKVYPPSNVEKYFIEAETGLKEAQVIFGDQIDEPSALWRAYNELGSVYCDWGYLILETRGRSQAIAKWNLSVENQEKALDVARKNNLMMQVIDSLDDLAQVCRDKGDLLRAQQWLDQIIALIPQEYWLATWKGFPEIEEPDETYWLALGKLHIQRAIWAFHDCFAASGEAKSKYLSDAITNYALSISYFLRYWPRSYSLGLTIRSFARHLRELGPERADEVRGIIRQVAQEYKVNLDTMLETLDNTLGV